jgi:predicted enzyme related to lactoylglutathione lyase
MKIILTNHTHARRRALLTCLSAAAFLLASNQFLSADTPPSLPPLRTMNSGGQRLPGKFIWADLVTDDVGAAQRFYHDLFGWSFRNMGGYAIGANQERPLCGIFHRDRPNDPSVHPRWFAYMSVWNVEKAQKEVTKLGGRVLAPPQKMPKRGEQAVFADPEGAVFGVIKSSTLDPEDFLPDAGDWIWIQLLSRDAGKAAQFYQDIGGYKIVENTQSTRLSDYVLTSSGYARATVRTIPKDQDQVRPNWLLFVRVSSITESVAKARQLGGQVLLEPKDDLLSGKVAVISDPSGAAIGLVEWSEDLLKKGQMT